MKTWDSVQSVDGRGEYSSQDLKNIPPLEVPGVYKLTIVSASHRAIEVKKPESLYNSEVLVGISEVLALVFKDSLISLMDISIPGILLSRSSCSAVNPAPPVPELELPPVFTPKYSEYFCTRSITEFAIPNVLALRESTL